MDFLLRLGDAVQLSTHVLDLLGLGMINIGTSRDGLVALFNLSLRVLVLLCHVALGLLRLRQLDLDVAQ